MFKELNNIESKFDKQIVWKMVISVAKTIATSKYNFNQDATTIPIFLDRDSDLYEISQQ
jgi:hypothetical protein